MSVTDFVLEVLSANLFMSRMEVTDYDGVCLEAKLGRVNVLYSDKLGWEVQQLDLLVSGSGRTIQIAMSNLITDPVSTSQRPGEPEF